MHSRIQTRNYFKCICLFELLYFRYSFYDGPPFATGLPHYGHILAGTIKDVVTRYAHQKVILLVINFVLTCASKKRPFIYYY